MKAEMGLELVERESKGAGAANEPVVITGEHYGLTLRSEKLHRRQMKRVQGSYRLRERFQCSCEYRRSQFYQSQATQKRADFVCVRSGQFARVNPGPNLILDQPAGNQRLLPETVGRCTVFRQEVSERDRSIEINQRSLRSCSSSFFSFRKDVTGLRGGGVDAASAGGVIQAFADCFGQQGIGQHGASRGFGRNDFRNDPIPVGDEDRLSAFGEANIFAEFILEDLQTDRFHNQ